MAETELGAFACRYPSDALCMERAEDGTPRFFRAADPARQVFSYQKPFILELEITRRCNLRCVHCYAHASDTGLTNELTLGEIERVLREGAALGIGELSMTGGEVLLREDFPAIIDAALALGYAVRFVTNATLLNDELLAQLCRRPIKLITISLDSVSPETHEQIRGDKSHAPAMRNILRLKEAGFHLSIITAFSRLNLAEFDGLLEFCLQNGLNWQIQMVSAKGRCERGITLSPEEYYALGEKVAAAYAADLPIRIIPMDDLATCSHFAPLSRLAETWQGRCTGGVLTLFVRADGDVTPCSALCFAETVVGNVRRESLRAICLEERCRRVLSWLTPELLTGVCADCPFKPECGGGCPEILLSMCRSRTENEYCYRRIEQARILEGIFR
ncbi:MAG: radical SAM protein [Desulfuromonadaceae bacterium]|nr:radical SAM protein [Desulfuromonadaceae bacterium]